MAQETGSEEQSTANPVQFATFLESSPPGCSVPIAGIRVFHQELRRNCLLTPDLQLHCDNEACAGVRFFVCLEGRQLSISTSWNNTFLKYTCRNCPKSQKVFAIIYRESKEGLGEAYKFGEMPHFGPPIPSRVISMIGPDREIFIRGRRAENQGLGIGAFAYYRRVVENQWRRVLEDITKVARRLGAPPAMIATIEAASKETQFSKAVDSIKDAIPSVLLIDGHNPVTLLHRALSEGLHEAPEEHCLELAGSIRVVLTELADRIGQALKDQQELKGAVSKLLNRKIDAQDSSPA